MPKYEVTFLDHFEAVNEDAVYDDLLAYLKECVDNGDVTAFGVYKLPNKEKENG
tara:strand:- start:377 stop:538 length:162 start_codon:yes stop_codon:yes gene_type:complete